MRKRATKPAPGNTVLDNALQAAIVTDSNRRIVYWNAAAEALYGWTADEVLGRDILEVTPTDPIPARQVMDPVDRGGAWAGEFSVRRKNGEAFTAFVTVTPLCDGAGDPVGTLGLSFDISDQPAAERRATAYIDGERRPAMDGDHRLMKPRGLALEIGVGAGLAALAAAIAWGLARIMPGVVPFATYFPAILAAAVLASWRSGFVASALALVFAVALGRLDVGRPADVVSLGLFTVASAIIVALGGYVNVLINRLGASRDALAVRNLHYGALFDTMSEGFALCEAVRDDEGRLIDYEILELNPALQRMLGVGPEVVGTRLSRTPGDRRAWLELCDRVLKTGKPESFETHTRRFGLWHEIHVSRVTDTRMAQFFFDITARKSAELRQAELFDELNHRVKNNLTLVSSLLQMQARSSASDVVSEQLMRAVDRVQSIAQVHAALYRGARKDSVDFGDYLRDLCGSLSQSLAADERIWVQVEAESLELPVDTAIPLGMVVNELVTNAVKYAFPEPESGLVTVRFGREDGVFRLVVSDTGRGLPPKFEERPGSLGMRLVRSLVSQVGGELAVRPEAGATFEVTLAADVGR